MEITLNKIVAILSERSGREFSIPFQQELKDIVNTWRARLIANSLQKKPIDRKFFLQSIVIPIIKIDKITCPISYGCILRSKEKVPILIRVNSTTFDFVGTPDFEDSFGVIQNFYVPFIKHNRYTKLNKKYIYRDNYLFIANNEEIDTVGIQGIFLDPSAAESINCLTGLATANCNADDLPYPVTGELLEVILQSVLKTELAMNTPKPNNEIEVNENIN